ncbi:hypothetical protein CEQ90_19615 [Lewinellaceae bacterium SD302]|nr:hypothetical protein CEQ90_19615 [Lewinellaceae bacterium SD302]
MKLPVKYPTKISVLILTIFFFIRPFRFKNINGEYLEIRFFKSMYNWEIMIPIFLTLLVFSLIELRLYLKERRKNFWSIILIFPVLITAALWIVNLIFSIAFV